MLSKKDNFLALARKEETDGIPLYNMMWGYRYPAIYEQSVGTDRVGIDYFGVEWYKGDNPTGASLPKPGSFILDDVTKWRDVIKVPDFVTDVDWPSMAKEHRDNWDPENPMGIMTGPSVGFFQALMSFMGFDEGLVACFEEPEEVKALMEYLTDWACEMTKLAIYHYKPDFGYLCDDIAHEHNPFVSTEQFRELFAPAWRRYYSVWLEAGLPVGMHNCGRFEPFVGDLIDMGCTFWDAVQSSNDVAAIKLTYNNGIALCMSPEGRFIKEDEITEESVRAEFGAWLDIAAPGGGLAINEGLANPPSEPRPGQSEKMFLRSQWMADVFAKRRYGYYN
jgi:uroporphyrinogen-III decarboxylase